MEFLAILGALICPILTLGCVLYHYNHPILGVIIMMISLFRALLEKKKNEYKRN